VRIICRLAGEVRAVVGDYEGVDCREVSEQEARKIAVAEAQYVFDLSAGAPLRAKLLKLGKEKYVFLLTLHHINFDGWSLGVLWKEVGTEYEARVRGEKKVLEPLEVGYSDYAAWQKSWLASGEEERQLGDLDW